MRLAVLVVLVGVTVALTAALWMSVPDGAAPTPRARPPTPWVETRVVYVAVTATATAVPTLWPRFRTLTAEARSTRPVFPTLVPSSTATATACGERTPT